MTERFFRNRSGWFHTAAMVSNLALFSYICSKTEHKLLSSSVGVSSSWRFIVLFPHYLDFSWFDSRPGGTAADKVESHVGDGDNSSPSSGFFSFLPDLRRGLGMCTSEMAYSTMLVAALFFASSETDGRSLNGVTGFCGRTFCQGPTDSTDSDLGVTPVACISRVICWTPNNTRNNGTFCGVKSCLFSRMSGSPPPERSLWGFEPRQFGGLRMLPATVPDMFIEQMGGSKLLSLPLLSMRASPAQTAMSPRSRYSRAGPDVQSQPAPDLAVTCTSGTRSGRCSLQVPGFTPPQRRPNTSRVVAGAASPFLVSTGNRPSVFRGKVRGAGHQVLHHAGLNDSDAEEPGWKARLREISSSAEPTAALGPPCVARTCVVELHGRHMKAGIPAKFDVNVGLRDESTI